MCDSKAQLYYACNLHLACNKRQQHGHTKICFIVSIQVYMSTIPYPYKMSRLLDNSWIHQLADCQLADWTSRGLDNSRIPPVTLRAEFSFFWRNLRDRKLSSPRVGNLRVGISASCPITLFYNIRHEAVTYRSGTIPESRDGPPEATSSPGTEVCW